MKTIKTFLSLTLLIFIYKLFFNVKNTVAPESSTALDNLSYIPNVIYINDKFSIRGQNEISILIDGGISPLRGME